MIINKELQKKVLQDYFFIQGKIKLDAKYFIKEINQSCNSDSNLNYKTNVKGAMTPFQYFKNNKKFLNLLQSFIEYVDDNVELPKYNLMDAWGFSLKPSEKTVLHNHYGFVWSGAIYLNSCNQTLDFPEINQSIKPDEGSFVLFSSFLKHGCSKNLDNSIKFGMSFNMMEMKPW